MTSRRPEPAAAEPSAPESSEPWLSVLHDNAFARFFGVNQSGFDLRDGEAWTDLTTAMNVNTMREIVCQYVNHQLATGVAEFEWARAAGAPASQQYYLAEAAITRHCSAWEYLFQVLTHILFLHEEIAATKGDYNALLGGAGSTR